MRHVTALHCQRARGITPHIHTHITPHATHINATHVENMNWSYHIQMSHVTRMNESCHAFEYVTSQHCDVSGPRVSRAHTWATGTEARAMGQTAGRGTGVLQRVVVCCSVVQCVAVFELWCSVLQCVAVCRNVLQCVAVCNSVRTPELPGIANTRQGKALLCCSVVQCVAVCFSDRQCAVSCRALPCIAVRYRACSVLIYVRTPE